MRKVCIYGTGRIGTIIAEALISGKVRRVQLIGVFNRTHEKAKKLADRLHVTAVNSLEELLALNPDYVVEAASGAAVKEIAIPVLQSGAELLVLSTGAFTDEKFYHMLQNAVEKYDGYIRLIPGAVGGFDILGAARMAGKIHAVFTNKKFSRDTEKGKRIMPELPDSFCGNAKEAYEMAPTCLNVAASIGLATNGLTDTLIKVDTDESINFRTCCEGTFGKAEIYTELGQEENSSLLTAFSAVYLLERLTERITY